jgi:hypothetical protein
LHPNHPPSLPGLPANIYKNRIKFGEFPIPHLAWTALDLIRIYFFNIDFISMTIEKYLKSGLCENV